MSCGFNLNTIGAGSSGAYDITWNGTNIFIMDAFDDHVYCTTMAGTNLSCGFKYEGLVGSVPRGIFTNNSIDFFISDGSDATVEDVVHKVSPYDYSEELITTQSLSNGKHNWSCSADDIGNTTLSNNRTLTISWFVVSSTNYNSSVFETDSQTFISNITVNTSITSASSYFWYNGTRYSATTSGAGGLYESTSTIDIPLISANGNKTFFWEWIFTFNSGSTERTNTTASSQYVNQTLLIKCDENYTAQAINFTTRQAVNPFPKLNATFKAAFSYWLGSGSVKRSYPFENISETLNNWTFCINPEYRSYTTDANIEYDAVGYAQNFYYLDNAVLTNTTNEIDLYLLNDSLATVTELIVQDKAQNPKPDIIIQIQMYDVGTDTYYTIGMGKTSSDGKDIVYLNWYATLYKFIFIQDGSVVKTVNPYKISSTPQTFTISDDIIYDFDKFRDFAYSLYFNNVTNNFVVTFVKPSGLVDQGCLRVTKRTPYNDTEICLTCESSSSATLYCNIGGYGNGTYIAHFYATGSWYDLGWIEYTISGSFAKEIYELLGNEDATAYAFLFSGIVVGVFFLSPVLSIIGLILGILGGAALGFTILNYTVFVGIVIVGLVIIWFVKR